MYHSGDDVDNGGSYAIKGKGYTGNLYTSLSICCKPNTALKKLS